MSKTVRVSIKKYDPLTDSSPHDEYYDIPIDEKMTILDGLIYIREKLDPNLAFDYGCRYACCGACSVKIDGMPTLICQERLQRDINVEPLENLPVLKDLVVDRAVFYSTLDLYQPFLGQFRDADEKRPDVLDPRDFENYKVVSRCIACFNCNSECGFIKDGEEFEGPLFFVQLARFLFDPRDGLDRRQIIEKAHSCTECGKCDYVCPKRIPIADTIRLIKTLPRSSVAFSGSTIF
jgi:succinate dehydrogenase/fumarate reductase iron-sulfur protein